MDFIKFEYCGNISDTAFDLIMNPQEELQLLSATFIEKDDEFRHLSGTGKLELEALYMTKIGNRQLELLNLQLEIKSMQRKIEEFNAFFQRNEKPSLASINAKILLEMTEVKEQLTKQKEMIVAAGDFLNNLIIPANPKELKEVYRRLAKKLHPDVSGNDSDKLNSIWLLVLEAYNRGDLEALKSLKIVYADELKNIREQEDDEAMIKEKITFLKSSIKSLNDKISVVLSNFPYTVEALLRNDDLIEIENEKIDKEIMIHEVYLQELITKFDEMTEGYGRQ